MDITTGLMIANGMIKKSSKAKPCRKNWRIEYEIPPLRAIYNAEADNCTEAEVRAAVKREQPLWRIRKLHEQYKKDKN